jgi:hypothetical protein
VDGRALTRLRIAFLLLAAALLLPLALLLRSVDARMEAQRRLRHELVAERIFDEMEGELTALLQHEDARPSDAYVGASTRVENWAPFVVGYFTRDSRGVQIVAKPQLGAERVRRLEAALQQPLNKDVRDEPRVAPSPSAAAHSPAAAPSPARAVLDALEKREAGGYRVRDDVTPLAGHDVSVLPEPPALEQKGSGALSVPTPATSTAQKSVDAVPEAILKQLNRAADVREREQARPAAKRKAKSAESNDDPLRGF